MRIAIDYRVMSTDAADRGMGRYTQQQLAAVLEHDRENEYLVLLFPGCRMDVIAATARRAPNVVLTKVELPSLTNGILGVPKTDVLRFSAEFQAWITEYGVDVYHATTPFLPPVIPDFDAAPFVATLYDLIPLVYPRHYFGAAAGRFQSGYDEYVRGLQLVSRAAHLLAISASARDDARAYLGYPSERATVAYPAVDPLFRPMPDDKVRRFLRRVGRRQPVPHEFALSVTGIHHSKNAGVLLAAHRKLLARGQDLPLVVVTPTLTAYQTFVGEFRIHDGVTVLHDVSDEELCALFNAASVVVHPSRYEGFGYPVAEAMSCGAPVITTTASSLPEVAGDAAVTVDPDDVAAFADAIADVTGSPEKLGRMRLLGLEQARRFGGEDLGPAALEAYAVASRATVSENGRRHLAVWSSLPPLRCGVGDYSAELSEALSGLADVELFVDDGYVPDPGLVGRQRVHHFSAFERRDRQQPFDAVIYQMGGDFMQEFMHDALRRRPGLVVLHDLLMGLGLFAIHRHRGKLDDFRTRVITPEGPDALSRYDAIMQSACLGTDPVPKLAELFEEHYLLGWLVDGSLAQIVHMESAAEEIATRYARASPSVVDMGVVDPLSHDLADPVAMLRWKYSIPRSAFVVGVFGSVVPVKRLEVCVQAVARVRERGLDCRLVSVGESQDQAYAARLDGFVESHGLRSAVTFVGHAPRSTFDELLVAADVVLNLRYPSLKGMSAVLVRALAAGKPTVISDVAEWRHLPEACCWRVAPGDDEIANVADRIESLATDTALYEASSAEARAFFERRGTLANMAAQYLDVVEKMLARTQSHAHEGAA